MGGHDVKELFFLWFLVRSRVSRLEITMQRYDLFQWASADCGVSVLIVPDCSRFVLERGSLRSPQPVENSLYFTRREGFSAFVVAHRLEFVPEHVVAADEGHEVFDGGFGGAVGEELQGEFFLAVRADFELFHR